MEEVVAQNSTFLNFLSEFLFEIQIKKYLRRCKSYFRGRWYRTRSFTIARHVSDHGRLIIHKIFKSPDLKVQWNPTDRFCFLGKYVEDSNYTYWLYVTVYYPLVVTFLLPCVFVFLIYFSSVTLYIFKFHRWFTFVFARFWHSQMFSSSTSSSI